MRIPSGSESLSASPLVLEQLFSSQDDGGKPLIPEMSELSRGLGRSHSVDRINPRMGKIIFHPRCCCALHISLGKPTYVSETAILLLMLLRELLPLNRTEVRGLFFFNQGIPSLLCFPCAWIVACVTECVLSDGDILRKENPLDRVSRPSHGWRDLYLGKVRGDGGSAVSREGTSLSLGTLNRCGRRESWWTMTALLLCSCVRTTCPLSCLSSRCCGRSVVEIPPKKAAVAGLGSCEAAGGNRQLQRTNNGTCEQALHEEVHPFVRASL